MLRGPSAAQRSPAGSNLTHTLFTSQSSENLPIFGPSRSARRREKFSGFPPSRRPRLLAPKPPVCLLYVIQSPNMAAPMATRRAGRGHIAAEGHTGNPAGRGSSSAAVDGAGAVPKLKPFSEVHRVHSSCGSGENQVGL